MSVQDLVVLQTSTPEFADILQYKSEDWKSVDKVPLLACMPEGLKEKFNKGKKRSSTKKTSRKKGKSSSSSKKTLKKTKRSNKSQNTTSGEKESKRHRTDSQDNDLV